jgi:hypothetical protein
MFFMENAFEQKNRNMAVYNRGLILRTETNEETPLTLFLVMHPMMQQANHSHVFDRLKQSLNWHIMSLMNWNIERPSLSSGMFLQTNLTTGHGFFQPVHLFLLKELTTLKYRRTGT